MSAAQGVVAAGREAKLLVHFRTSYLTKVRSRHGPGLAARRPKPCTQAAPAPPAPPAVGRTHRGVRRGPSVRRLGCQEVRAAAARAGAGAACAPAGYPAAHSQAWSSCLPAARLVSPPPPRRRAHWLSCRHVGEELLWEGLVPLPAVPAFTYRLAVVNEAFEVRWLR